MFKNIHECLNIGHCLWRGSSLLWNKKFVVERFVLKDCAAKSITFVNKCFSLFGSARFDSVCFYLIQFLLDSVLFGSIRILENNRNTFWFYWFVVFMWMYSIRFRLVLICFWLICLVLQPVLFVFVFSVWFKSVVCVSLIRFFVFLFFIYFILL